MAVRRMPIDGFVAGLAAAKARGDGYIMGAKGQDPRKWSAGSWWFTQYSGGQKVQALYWREHARRVWDCNGLAEGLYEEWAGVDINTRARYNYSSWCGLKGKGLIPAQYRVPGAAVFWGDSAASIHHVAYLYRPVTAGDAAGDWYLIEARGVMYGVVQTRLNSRKPGYWGWMDKYFDYGAGVAPAAGNLRNGSEGEAVRGLQTALIRLGYDLGRWGADGDFGDMTELAVRAFQRDSGLEADGIAGPKTQAALDRALAALDAPPAAPKKVKIVGGQCYIRSAPDTATGEILGVARADSEYAFQGETSEKGWLRIAYGAGTAWVSGVYGRLVSG